MRSSVIQTLTAVAFLAVSVKAQVPAYVDLLLALYGIIGKEGGANYHVFLQLHGRTPLGTWPQ